MLQFCFPPPKFTLFALATLARKKQTRTTRHLVAPWFSSKLNRVSYFLRISHNSGFRAGEPQLDGEDLGGRVPRLHQHPVERRAGLHPLGLKQDCASVHSLCAFFQTQIFTKKGNYLKFRLASNFGCFWLQNGVCKHSTKNEECGF